MSGFHYLAVSGEDGGVERVAGTASGQSLAQLVKAGPPPLSIALALIASLAELIAITEDDGLIHGHLSLDAVKLDAEGVLRLDGFGGGGIGADRLGLGRLAIGLLGGNGAGALDDEEALLDAVLSVDLSDLDGGMIGDVQWFLARLLDPVPSRRPDPVEVWRTFVAFASMTPGPRLNSWAPLAARGGGERRSVARQGPLEQGLDAPPPNRHGTAFLTKDALRGHEEPPPPGGGNKTAYWTAEQLLAMEKHTADAPRPRRTSIAQQQTVIREEVKIKRSPKSMAPTVLQMGQEAEAMPLDDDRRKFAIEQCLGRGGFGEVYLCTMTSAGGMRSRVAVKVLREGIDPRAQAVRRLRDEARVLGTLQHPAILTAHDLILLAERVAMVTEYVPGADLDACLDSEDPPPLRALLEVLAVTSEALDASWNAPGPDGSPLHLVHRDIKPSNIRIGTHGQVKVLDFGIAKFASEREAKTQANQMIGTLLYMAPERMASHDDQAAGDVYAVGAILYEALAGKSLWGDLTSRQQYMLSMVEADHDGHVAPLIQGLHCSDGLKAILTRALAFDPDRRQSAADLARALEDAADETPGRNLRRWAREHNWPPPAFYEAELVGRTLTEGRPTSSSSALRPTSDVSLGPPPLPPQKKKKKKKPEPPPPPKPEPAKPPPPPVLTQQPDVMPPDQPTGRIPLTAAPQPAVDLADSPAPPPAPTFAGTSLPADEPPRHQTRPVEHTEFGEWFGPGHDPEAAEPADRGMFSPGDSVVEDEPAALPASQAETAQPAARVDEPSPPLSYDPTPSYADPEPIQDRRGMSPLVLLGVAGVGLFLFIAAGTVAVGTGLLFASSGEAGEAVADVGPSTPTPEPDVASDTDAAPVEDAEPAGAGTTRPRPAGQPSPRPSADGVAVVEPSPDPAQGGDGDEVVPPQPGVVPEPGPVSKVSAAASSTAACADPVALEPNAMLGKLSGSQRSCVETRMADTSLTMTDRQALGRVLLVDTQARCTKGQACPAFEALQRRFFEDFDQSDPDMMLAYATHMFKTAGGKADRYQQALDWAGRAMQRKNAWGSGRARNDKMLLAHKIRAVAATEVWKASPNDAKREQARDRAVEWAELRRNLALDDSDAVDLCLAAAGSADVCNKRITAEAVTVEIRLLSIPPRAQVTVDGGPAKSTPFAPKLSYGKHTIVMQHGDKRAEKTIQVGAGQPISWQWVVAEDTWRTSL